MQPASTRPVFRFAPSPNGYLHLGHAQSALTNYEQARAAGGRAIIGVPDRFIEHGARGKLLERLGFTPAALADRIAAHCAQKVVV